MLNNFPLPDGNGVILVNLQDKLAILSSAAKYDVSCSSSGSKRRGPSGEPGNTSMNGICHSWTEDGRCVSLLKILFTNVCIYDCQYCANRASIDTPRASFTPGEVCWLTVEFYRRNYIEGLFLSSAIEKSTDYTMERLVETVQKLRETYHFHGYIHLKGLPGADQSLINRAGYYVDRLSLNLELPTRKSLETLAPGKKHPEIMQAVKQVSAQIKVNRAETKKFRSAEPFVPAGQSTQLVIGASPDSDRQILKLTERLYDKYSLKRVYYSAYIPVNVTSEYLASYSPPYLREHRLYQADWLLRFYNFTPGELLKNGDNLNYQLDPKADYALRHLHLFPLEVNRAPKYMLLKVPGIGPKSAARIIKNRRYFALKFEDLKRLGVVVKRARYFVTCQGKYHGGVPMQKEVLTDILQGNQSKQLTLF